MPTTITAECRVCGEAIEDSDEILECPSCGAIQEFTPRRRSDDNRPRRESFVEVRSDNFNGVHKIYKNLDGTLGCSCPSFMKGNGGSAGALSYACKHIKQVTQNDGLPPLNVEPPSEWQIAALKKLGISNPDRLSNCQAYYLINDILAYQGVTYREYEQILHDHGKVSVLPILPVGVEFEGYVFADVGRTGLRERLETAGLPSVVPGYTHNQLLDSSGRPMYKLVMDSTIRRVNGYEPVEIVTPKLFGADGFDQIRRALTIWREAGSKVNGSCGCHVHIDAYNYKDRDLLELMKLWAKIECSVIWYFVSPSRRNGIHSRAVTGERILQAAMHGASSVTRYLSLNIAAWGRYKTVEFRLHQGTTAGSKIIPWIVFLMKLTEAVKNGLTHRDVEPTLESVFTAIGMDDSATSRITKARAYLTQRYDDWKRDAEENPSHMPQVDSIDFEAVEREIEAIVSRRSSSVDNVRTSVSNDPLTIDQLSQCRASTNIWLDIADPDRNAYQVSSVRGDRDRQYWITRNGDRLPSRVDTLECECPGFNHRGRCTHSIILARALMRVIRSRRYTRTNEPSNNVAVAAGR